MCGVLMAKKSDHFFIKPTFFQNKIYMYGGKIDATGNVTNQLWVFHIHNESWVQVTPEAKEQYAVVGHSAHVVTLEDGSVVMLVIFGHCPLYGYISNMQEYNLGRYSLTTCLYFSVQFATINQIHAKTEY